MRREQRLAEFFGLWTFAVRLAAIIGPMTYGLVTLLTAGNHRIAILSTGIFFVIGLLVLAQGRRGARRGRGARDRLNPAPIGMRPSRLELAG